MATHTGAAAPGLAPGEGHVWHTLSADGVLRAEKVDEQYGLSSAEVASPADRFGPNKFDTGTAEPRWRVFLRQYADLMQIVLLVAGVVSLALKEWETGIVLVALTLFNAVLGLQQEGKAAASVAALQKMMIIKAKAKAMRDGQLQEIPAEQLVPGDIVSIEAGGVRLAHLCRAGHRGRHARRHQLGRHQVRHRHRRIDPDAPAGHCLRPAAGVPQDHQPGCPPVADLPGRGAIHSRPIRDPEGRAAAYRTRP